MGTLICIIFASFWAHCWVLLKPVCSMLTSKITLGGAPRRTENQVGKTNALPRESFKQTSPTWDPQVTMLVVFSILCEKITPNQFWYEFRLFVLLVMGYFFVYFHDLFACHQVSFGNQLILLKVHCAHTGAWILRREVPKKERNETKEVRRKGG